MDRPISKFQNTQFELAKMRANTEAAKLLVYQAACAKDDHERFTHLAAMAKLVSANNASDVTRRCLQYSVVMDIQVIIQLKE